MPLGIILYKKFHPSGRSHLRAIAYRQISARLGHAAAKASDMRLLGIPRLPLPPLVPRSVLARNCRFLFLLLSSPRTPLL